MVVRDRNSPSIVVWSLCNELGCVAGDPNGGDLAVQFKLAVYAVDTTRPVTGNTVQTPYLGNRFVDGFAFALDVQSFSCKLRRSLDSHVEAERPACPHR